MKLPLIALLVMSLAASAAAQEMRATLSGTVTDPSASAVSGATITVRNTSTNLTLSTTSNASGGYILPQLPTGPYEITAEMKGFRKYTRTGITLAVADKATVDIRLELGALVDTVTVSAELAGTETSQSVTGQLLSSEQVAAMPLNGRAFFTMLNLSAGVNFTQKVGPNQGWIGTRTWENGPYAGAFSMHGGKANTNAFLVDGGALGVEGGITWVPLNDAIEEVKVSTPTSDASLGLSGGGVINVIMKSGTNDFHGILSHFIRNNKFEALQTQVRRTGAKAAKHQWNSYSALISGPIIRNKFFFSAGFDGFRERQPWSTVQTVPTELERQGDYSQTLNAAGQMILIYDPLTTRQVGSEFVRDPFPANRLTRLSPIARNYLPFFPSANARGDFPTTTRNFISVTNGKVRNDAWHVKLDYLTNERHRTSATVSQNWGDTRGSRRGLADDSPASESTNPFTRTRYGAVLDHTWAVNPTTVLNGRLSWDRWVEGQSNDYTLAFDGSKLGFQGAVSPLGTRFVAANVTGMIPLGTNSFSYRPDNNYTASGDVSKTIGKHFMKFGTRVIESRYNFNSWGTSIGTFSFTSGFTQRNPLLAEPNSGYPFASLMLGYPSSGSVAINDSIAATTHIYGFYVQDDFKVTSKLTLNFGLRWDIQTPPTERYNRSVRTFDPNVSYTLNNVPVKGGLVFADSEHRTRYNTRYRDFQPRLGLSYRAMRRVVLRTSYGLSMLPNNAWGGLGSSVLDQTGYSRTTPFVATTGAGVDSFIPNRPGAGTWENPFPDGFLLPYGNTLGPKTNVGQAVSFISPDYLVPRVHQFQFGLELEMPWRTTLETSYVGSRTRKFRISRNLNVRPLQRQIESIGVSNYWNLPVSNPFSGAPEMAGTVYANPTITTAAASTPFPQFTQVTVLGLPTGETDYNSFASRVNKRMSHGLNFSLSYTFSKTISSTTYRTDWDTKPFRQIDVLDVPHHFALATFWELPFGSGRRLGAQWGKPLNRIAGGWTLNFTVEKSSGLPINMPGDAMPVNDPLSPRPTDGRYFQTCTQLLNGSRFNCTTPTEPVYWRQPNFNEIELARHSERWAQVREPSRAIWNISLFKEVPVTDRLGVELRAEAYNAFNTPQYNGANTTRTSALFGRVQEDQYNFPRAMQFALRLKF